MTEHEGNNLQIITDLFDSRIQCSLEKWSVTRGETSGDRLVNQTTLHDLMKARSKQNYVEVKIYYPYFYILFIDNVFTDGKSRISFFQ